MLFFLQVIYESEISHVKKNCLLLHYVTTQEHELVQISLHFYCSLIYISMHKNITFCKIAGIMSSYDQYKYTQWE